MKDTGLLFLICIAFLHSSTAQSGKIDSLREQLRPPKPEAAQVGLLNEIANELNSYDLREALTYGWQALPLAATAANDSLTAEVYITLGRTHANSSAPDSALFYFDKALAIFRQLDDSAGQADVLSKLQWVSNYLGEYERAVELAFESLKIRQEQGEPKATAMAYTDVGQALISQGKPEEGLKYALMGLRQMEALPSPLMDIGVGAQLVADTCLDLGQLDSALYFAERALQVRREDGDQIDIGLSLNTRGNIYKFMERYDEALADYAESNTIARSASFTGLEMATLNNTADAYLRQGEYARAFPILRRLQQQVQETGEQFKEPEILLLLSESFEGMGQLDSALHYYKQSALLNDSLRTEAADARVAELQTQYETAQKEALIARQKEELSQARLIRNFSFGIVGLLAVIAVLLFLGYRNNKKKNKAIEALLHEIHHRVKNNLQVLSSLLRLQSRYIEDEGALDALREGQNRVDAMGLIHQQLYTGETPAALNMKSYLEELGETVLHSFGETAGRVKIDYQVESVELDADTAIPLGLIVNELLTNSLKYAFPEGRQGCITIRFKQEAGAGYLLSVEDDGVGKARAESDSRSTAFGSRLIKVLGQKIKASVTELDGQGYGMALRFA